MIFAILLLQVAIYLGVLVVDDYAGTLLALILGAICFSIWGISHVVEWIQPSRVRKDYYRYIMTGWMAPLISFICFVLLKGGVDWIG